MVGGMGGFEIDLDQGGGSVGRAVGFGVSGLW